MAVAIGTDFQHVMFNIKSSELSDISHNYHGNYAQDLYVMSVKIMSMAFTCMSGENIVDSAARGWRFGTGIECIIHPKMTIHGEFCDTETIIQ